MSLACFAPAQEISNGAYYELPRAERQQLIENASLDSKHRLYVMERKLIERDGLGEAVWKGRMRSKSISARGLGDLRGFFACRSDLWGMRYSDKADQIVSSGGSESEQLAEDAVNREERRASEVAAADALELITYLAPTPDALALNRRAAPVAQRLERRLYGGSTNPPSDAELAEVDRLADELLPQIRSLPKLTPEQVDAEIMALLDK